MRNVRGAEDVIDGHARARLPGLRVRDQHTIDSDPQRAAGVLPARCFRCRRRRSSPSRKRAIRKQFRLHRSAPGPFRWSKQYARASCVRLCSATASTTIQGIRTRRDEFPSRLHSFRDVAEAFLRGELDIAHGVPLNIVGRVRSTIRSIAPYLLTTASSCTRRTRLRLSSRAVRSRGGAPGDELRHQPRTYQRDGLLRPRRRRQVAPPAGTPRLRPGPCAAQPYDPDRARTLIARPAPAAGFASNTGPGTRTSSTTPAMVPLIIEDLAAIGIKVST